MKIEGLNLPLRAYTAGTLVYYQGKAHRVLKALDSYRTFIVDNKHRVIELSPESTIISPYPEVPVKEIKTGEYFRYYSDVYRMTNYTVKNAGSPICVRSNGTWTTFLNSTTLVERLPEPTLKF